MVGSFVVLYLFLGGCGAAVVLVAAIWSLLFGRTRTRTAEQTRAFTALRARLFAAGLVLLVLGSLCLLLDLGRPERFILGHLGGHLPAERLHSGGGPAGGGRLRACAVDEPGRASRPGGGCGGAGLRGHAVHGLVHGVA